MKTLLITGPTGFIGRNILKYVQYKFESRFRVVLLSSTYNSQYTTVLHHNYTFTKNNFIAKGIETIDIVLHIGAFAPKSRAESDDISKSNSNIINTKHLLDNLPNIPLKFIFLSTIDVYGNIKTKINENSTTTPLSMYGWSKLYCEKMIENWAIENKVTIQILRIGHIYGKGEEAYKKVIPISIQKLKKSKSPEIFGTGKEKRSFLHVKDVCSLIIKSIDLEKYEGVINLCSSNSYTIIEIVNMLVEISGKNTNIKYIKTENKSIDFSFESSKMNQLLGDEKINIKEGLKDEYN